MYKCEISSTNSASLVFATTETKFQFEVQRKILQFALLLFRLEITDKNVNTRKLTGITADFYGRKRQEKRIAYFRRFSH